MAIRKDQLDSRDPAAPPAAPLPKPASPVSAGLPGAPQKTNGEGPAFDFDHPEVLERASSLRSATAELKAVCERWAVPAADAAGYAGLRADLESVLPGFYARYDAYVAAVLRTGDSAPSCARGCPHCCSHYVESVEPFELIFLHGRIARQEAYPSRVIALHRRASLFGSLLRERDGDLAEDKALYRYYLRGVPCPFLGPGGACGVYAERPMSCRMFFSLSRPDLCKGRNVVDPRNRNFLIELPEDVEAELARAGAALAAYGFPESLFAGLVEANSAFGRFDAPGGT